MDSKIIDSKEQSFQEKVWQICETNVYDKKSTISIHIGNLKTPSVLKNMLQYRSCMTKQII